MTIKASDLRPCDNCGGPIAPHFYVLRFSIAIIKPDAVNQYLGMHQFFGGRAGAALVENFAPASTDAVAVGMDQAPELGVELFICQTCYLDKPLDLAMLHEAANERMKAKEKKDEDHQADSGERQETSSD